jgi:hypothetical protein
MFEKENPKRVVGRFCETPPNEVGVRRGERPTIQFLLLLIRICFGFAPFGTAK